MNILFLEWKNFGKEDILEAFTRLGHQVKCISTQLIYERHSQDFEKLFSDAINNGLNGNAYDVVFTFNYSPVISICCKKHNIKYISWTYDSPLVALYSYTLINDCNYVFIFDKVLYDEFKSAGINTVYYMPLAVNISRIDKMIPNSAVHERLDCSVAFVGSLYNESHNLFERFNTVPEYVKGYLDAIMEAQLKVNGYYFIEDMLKGDILSELEKAVPYPVSKEGIETPAYIYAYYFIARKLAEIERTRLLKSVSESFNTNLYTHQATPSLPAINNCGAVDYYDTMPYIFKCSKINLNITLRSIRSGIPLRALDIMGAGGFLMTNYQADMFDYFIPDEDFVFYDGEDDLINKCSYYLEHDEERIAIANNGYKKIKSFHTYEKRLEEIFAIVFG